MDHIKLHIQQGRIGEALQELIAQFGKSSYGKELMVLSARHFSNQRENRMGVISDREFKKVEKDITADLLASLTLMEEEMGTRMEKEKTAKRTLLFCESNPFPAKNLFSNVEMREIQDILDQQASIWELKIRLGLSLDQFIRWSNEFHPSIIHFTSYSTDEGIYFHDKADQLAFVPNAQFRSYVNMLSKQVECLFFNTFISESLAQEISSGKTVIGFNGIIQSLGAISFATGFYTAIGYGQDYQLAYEVGRQALLGGQFAADEQKLFGYVDGERMG